MTFLFPAFLFALAAVAVPVIIHLFNFRKYKKVYFTNVKLLQNIEQQTSSSKSLKRWLILTVRILAIFFLVLAFAKPFVPSAEQTKFSGDQLVNIYLDNSYSMEAVNREGTLLDEAKRRAKEIASGYGPGAKFQLLTNDFEGRHQRFVDYDELKQNIDEVKISGSARTLPQIIRRQTDALANHQNSPKNIFIISDFQRSMLSSQAAAPDSVITLNFVRLQANQLPNISIDSAWFISPVHRPGIREQLVVKMVNNADKDSEKVPVKLEVNGSQKAIGTVNIKARSFKNDTLSFSGLGAGWQKGKITIRDYPVTFDNTYFISFLVQKSLPVLAINNQGLSPYLQAVYRSDPFFNLSNVSSGNVNYSGLSAYPLVILNNLDSISDGLSRELRTFVNKGGSVFIYPAINKDFTALRRSLQTLGTDLPVELVNQETKATAINHQSRLFQNVFENIPRNMDLPVAKKYIRYSAATRTNKQLLISFSGNEALLSSYRIGKGTIYLSAVPLDDQASNFVRHALFVPVMYQAALSGVNPGRISYSLENDQVIEIPKTVLPANQNFKLRSGSYEIIPDIRQTENATRLFVSDQIKNENFYDLYKADSLIGSFAFNNSRSESDMSFMSEAQIKSHFAGSKTRFFNPEKTSMQNEVKAVQQGSQLWKVCLILALIFLAAEVLLIRYYRTKSFSLNTI